MVIVGVLEKEVVGSNINVLNYTKHISRENQSSSKNKTRPYEQILMTELFEKDFFFQ